jgi:hypothetical protein
MPEMEQYIAILYYYQHCLQHKILLKASCIIQEVSRYVYRSRAIRLCLHIDKPIRNVAAMWLCCGKIKVTALNIKLLIEAGPSAGFKSSAAPPLEYDVKTRHAIVRYWWKLDM